MRQKFSSPPDRIKSFIAGCLSTAVIVCSIQTTEADVSDNSGSAFTVLASWLGMGKEDSDPNEYGGSLVERMDYVASEVSSLSSSIEKIELNTDSLKATAGGGIYVSCYSKKAYLNKYKLRITDGTVTKTTTISYNSDSDLYEGNLTAPFTQNSITITILEYGSGDNQGSVTATIDKTNSYATINIDPLLESNLSTLLAVDDALALSMSSDDSIVKNDTYFPTVLNHVYDVNHDVGDFLHALTGDEYSSDTFDELLGNETEFVNAVAGDGSGRSVLSRQEVTDSIINDRAKLKWISLNTDAKTSANGNSVFTTSIRSSSLAETQTKPGGQENKVEGNIICISIKSGAIGKIGQTHCVNSYYHSDCSNMGCLYSYHTYYISSRPKNYVDSECLIDSSTGAVYRYWTSCSNCGQKSGDTTSDLSGNASTLSYSGKFASTITISSMSGTYSASYYYNEYGSSLTSISCSASDSAASSVITYINLDTE